MQPCVSCFRLLCAEDLELRCGLVQQLDHDPMQVEDVPDLPTDIAVACLLNPLVGGTWWTIGQSVLLSDCLILLEVLLQCIPLCSR
jgi:hypothetical protein